MAPIMSFVNGSVDTFQDFTGYNADIHQMNREDAIELANILRFAQSPFLRQVGLEVESELMEVQVL